MLPNLRNVIPAKAGIQNSLVLTVFFCLLGPDPGYAVKNA